jgi:hypothetical protein
MGHGARGARESCAPFVPLAPSYSDGKPPQRHEGSGRSLRGSARARSCTSVGAFVDSTARNEAQMRPLRSSHESRAWSGSCGFDFGPCIPGGVQSCRVKRLDRAMVDPIHRKESQAQYARHRATRCETRFERRRSASMIKTRQKRAGRTIRRARTKSSGSAARNGTRRLSLFRLCTR